MNLLIYIHFGLLLMLLLLLPFLVLFLLPIPLLLFLLLLRLFLIILLLTIMFPLLLFPRLPMLLLLKPISLSKYNAGILGLSRAFQDMDCGYYVNVEIFVGSRKIYSLIMLTYCPIFIEIVRTALRCSGVRLGLIRNLFLLP